MENTYREVFDTDGKLNFIERIEDKAAIPLDPANSDYQKYLKSLDEACSK